MALMKEILTVAVYQKAVRRNQPAGGFLLDWTAV